MYKMRKFAAIGSILLVITLGAALMTHSQQVFLGASAYFPDDNLLEAIQDSIESPQRVDLNALAVGEPIVVAVSQFSEPKLAETLISTKRRLSATVQVLLESPMESADSTTPTSNVCGQLVNSGIRVRHVPNMNHKFLVMGSSHVVTSSGNWTKQALQNEANNVIVLNNAELGRKYRDEFERLWNADIAQRGCPNQ